MKPNGGFCSFEFLVNQSKVYSAHGGLTPGKNRVLSDVTEYDNRSLVFSGGLKLVDIGRKSYTSIMSAERGGNARTGMFSASTYCVQIIAT